MSAVVIELLLLGLKVFIGLSSSSTPTFSSTVVILISGLVRAILISEWKFVLGFLLIVF